MRVCCLLVTTLLLLACGRDPASAAADAPHAAVIDDPALEIPDLADAPAPTGMTVPYAHPCHYVVPPIMADVTGVPESLDNFRHRLAIYALEEWELVEDVAAMPPEPPVP